jgi:hypothetical protein
MVTEYEQFDFKEYEKEYVIDTCVKNGIPAAWGCQFGLVWKFSWTVVDH